MYEHVIFVFTLFAFSVHAVNPTQKHHITDQIAQDLYSTIKLNIRENTRKLKLDDFSWGIFKGAKGHLHGFDDFNLTNNTLFLDDQGKLNVTFEFAVQTLQAVWDKSICFGYSCSMKIELRDAVFVLRMLFDSNECVINHLAYLKSYRNARSEANYAQVSTISTGVVETTVKILSQVLNTQPFEKIIKENVNYALLPLPLFAKSDIKRLCSALQETE